MHCFYCELVNYFCSSSCAAVEVRWDGQPEFTAPSDLGLSFLYVDKLYSLSGLEILNQKHGLINSLRNVRMDVIVVALNFVYN